MSMPLPTPIYRLTHVDNLSTLLTRSALHAPHHSPQDGLPYKTIHDVDIQSVRQTRTVRCGPRGVIHDYVAFYLGPRPPMLLRLNTGRVHGYNEDQIPIVYLVAEAQDVAASGAGFVFTDGHGIAAYTRWFDSLDDLDKVDWEVVHAQRWSTTVDDMDRQRRKQAEFLAYRSCDWRLIREIGVVNDEMKTRVMGILGAFPSNLHRPVNVRPEWYC